MEWEFCCIVSCVVPGNARNEKYSIIKELSKKIKRFYEKLNKKYDQDFLPIFCDRKIIIRKV